MANAKHIRIGLFLNPFSHRNKSVKADLAHELSRYQKDLFTVFVEKSEQKVFNAVKQMRAEGIRTIIIDGGDGTVSRCLTAISQIYPDNDLPDIAILPSGNTNLIAVDVGYGMRGIQAIRDIIASGHTCTLKRRRPIRMIWPDGSRPQVLGMFGGCTGFERAIRIAHNPTLLKSAPHALGVIVSLTMTIFSIFIPSKREIWLAGQKFRRDGNPETRNSALMLVTSLEHLTYGIWPFWGKGNKGFYFLNVYAHPPKVLINFFHFLRGKFPKSITKNPAFESSRVERMTINIDSCFVMDGELYPTDSHGKITLEEGPVFNFMCMK